MVISKCVPLEISRKKFSQFLQLEQPTDAIFVGLKNIDGKPKNIKIPYDTLKEDILLAIKQDPEWGQGGSGGGSEDKPSDEVTVVNVNEIGAFPISLIWEEDQEGVGAFARRLIGEGGTWDDSLNTNRINLANKQGFIEINAGDAYILDFVLLKNQVVGTVTNIVVDNTGLPISKPNEDGEIQNVVLPPSDNFTLYYGMDKLDEQGNPLNYEILTVPPMCRGIVQILHTHDSDIIVHSSYSQAMGKVNGVEQDDYYVEDMLMVTDDQGDGSITYDTNNPINATPTGTNKSSFDIDMQNQRGYIDFQTRGELEYTFWFSNPELGTSTYIVVDNSYELYKYDVKIIYGKRMDPSIDTDDWTCDVTTVGNEKCVIEVFHSLSADIIVKITKV